MHPESAQLFFPWGKYSYLHLPMGIADSPDIFQGKMSQLMMVLEYVKAYLDDLLVIPKSTFLDHLKNLRPVLIKLQEAGLKINSTKSKFCALVTEYLGYSLSRKEIAPPKKKIDAILALSPPTKLKE